MRALGILGAVAALLAAYLLFFDHDPRARSSAPGARLMPALDRAAVRRVTIARAGEPAFALVRAADDWRIEPGNAAAARGAVEDLVNAIDEAESQRTADLAAEAAGLSPPRVTLSLGDGQRSAGLELGKPDASGRGVFVQTRPGDAVLVAPRRILELADRSAEAFRDRRLLWFSPDLVTHVGWRSSLDGPEHGWNRTGDRWRNGTGDRLAPERVAAVLRRIADLRSAAPPADAGAAAGGWIDLRGPSGAQVHITPAQLPGGTLDELWRALSAADAPDRRLLAVPPGRVRRVSLEDRARRLTLLRDGGSGQPWRFGPPDDQTEVDEAAVDDWLARLAVTNLAAPASTGRRIIVDDRDDEAITVGRADPGYDLLAPDPLRFRSRKVLDFAHFDVRELKRAGGGVAFDLHTTDGETWTTPQASAPIDRTAVERVAGALGNLRAESFLGAAPQGAPQIALDVAVQPPGAHVPAWHRLELWDACLGRADGTLTFRIARATCDELRLDPTAKR